MPKDANIRAALDELQRHLGTQSIAPREDQSAAGAARARVLRRSAVDWACTIAYMK